MKLELLAMYHPAAAIHQPRLWATIVDDWTHLPERVDSSYTVTDKLPVSGVISLDTENAPDGTLGQWSIAYRSDGTVYVLPFFGRRPEYKPCGDHVIMHNAKWDLRVLRNNKMPEPANVVDTMIGAYCLGLGKQEIKTSESYDAAGMVGGLGLKYLARRHLGMEMDTWQQVHEHPEKIPEYNAKDSVATLLLWEKFEPDLPKFFWEIDMPLLPVLMAMEDRGISLNPQYLDKFSQFLNEELSKIELGDINPFAPKQVAEYIYEVLKIEPWKFTETGQPSTDKEVLETIDDPLVKKILKYKELYKEKGTYIKNYVERLTPEGRIHPEFKQCSTSTGRLSCSKPNLQNVPKTDMRKLFVAPHGKKLIRVDWSQIELRLFAAVANEKNMIEVFERDGDIHQETAEVFGVTRYQAKTINFLMLYGGSAWKISQEFHIPIDKAKEGLARYFKRFPGIAEYYEKIRADLKATKTVEAWTGRKRRIDAMMADDWRIREQGFREGVNMPIQGGAGEIVKLAMIDLHNNHQAPMLIQVHDELLFEVDEKDAEEYAHWLNEYLPTLTEVNGMTFPVNVSVGNNWKETMDADGI